MNREQEKIKVLLKCFDAIAHTTRENLDGYDSEWLETKLMHIRDYITLSMEKLTDIYEVEQTELAEKREVRKIEEEILEENLNKVDEEYSISWDEIDKQREEARKKAYKTLTKPLSKKAKKRYAGHSKSGKAPKIGSVANNVSSKRKLKTKDVSYYRNLAKTIKVKPLKKDMKKVKEIYEYITLLRRHMILNVALKKLKMSTRKYYSWFKALKVKGNKK